MTHFPTELSKIYQRVDQVDPEKYAHDRNYKDGHVSRLSPYISRGVLSTKQVVQLLMKRGFNCQDMEKFIQELAWRDYWQICWQTQSVLTPRLPENDHSLYNQLPKNVATANTGIKAIDLGIKSLLSTGYMHNHMRLYVAMLVCNVCKTHWLTGASWMHYHLLDADGASNMLSWQWVAGVNSKKRYMANQENINRYFNSDQVGSFLDVSYEELPKMPIPEALNARSETILPSILPDSDELCLAYDKTALYTIYNLDPEWRKNETLNKILIIEPTHLAEFPLSEKVIEFITLLGQNIPDLQVYVGAFKALKEEFPDMKFVFKEHPANAHFEGQEDSRDWLFNYHTYQPSFFKFWNKVKKEMRTW